MDRDQKRRLHDIVAGIYSSGYAEGMDQTANAYDVREAIPGAGARMGEQLKVRIGLVDKAVDSYIKRLENVAKEYREKGLTGDLLYSEVSRVAGEIAGSKAEMISQIEFAEARLDGAGNILSESGISYEWRFPHADLGTDHEECPICEEIRRGSPYTEEEAEAEGFPEYPHPGCDHLWTIVPVGEQSKTEEFPPSPEWPRFEGGLRVPIPSG